MVPSAEIIRRRPVYAGAAVISLDFSVFLSDGIAFFYNLCYTVAESIGRTADVRREGSERPWIDDNLRGQ